MYSQISHSNFLQINIQGRLVSVNTANANSVNAGTFSYVSCDPEDYTGVLSVADVFRMVVNSQQANSVVLYSTTSNHCDANNLQGLQIINGVFTTLDPVAAAGVATRLANSKEGEGAVIEPDQTSYTNGSNGIGNTGSPNYAPGTSPTTAVAMIILYTITGIITALFITIIITGAIRAHRHPERYGPRTFAGRPRQSRAKGIARAMLETLPVVKFGDHKDLPVKPDGDIEMNRTESPTNNQSNAETAEGATEPNTNPDGDSNTAEGNKQPAAAKANADGTDQEGHLGCSICTEDFNKGDEVRVLPCNHKFHPECVDPWLLNVSGTCPLCRIDLRPKEEQQASSGEGSTGTANAEGSGTERSGSVLSPPLGAATASGRRVTVAHLRQIAGGTREERIAALRQFSQQRRNRRATEPEGQHTEEQRSVAGRLRDRFRVRTRRIGEESGTGRQESVVVVGRSDQEPTNSSTTPSRST